MHFARARVEIQMMQDRDPEDDVHCSREHRQIVRRADDKLGGTGQTVHLQPPARDGDERFGDVDADHRRAAPRQQQAVLSRPAAEVEHAESPDLSEQRVRVFQRIDRRHRRREIPRHVGRVGLQARFGCVRGFERAALDLGALPIGSIDCDHRLLPRPRGSRSRSRSKAMASRPRSRPSVPALRHALVAVNR